MFPCTSFLQQRFLEHHASVYVRLLHVHVESVKQQRGNVSCCCHATYQVYKLRLCVTLAVDSKSELACSHMFQHQAHIVCSLGSGCCGLWQHASNLLCGSRRLLLCLKRNESNTCHDTELQASHACVAVAKEPGSGSRMLLPSQYLLLLNNAVAKPVLAFDKPTGLVHDQVSRD